MILYVLIISEMEHIYLKIFMILPEKCVMLIISKGNFRFAPVVYLSEALKNIDKMQQSTFDEIVEKYVIFCLIAFLPTHLFY